MKNQALSSSKDKGKKLKCRLLQFLFGALRVKLFLACGVTYCFNKMQPLIIRLESYENSFLKFQDDMYLSLTQKVI